MEERTKLGRGLKEISQIYLSGDTRDEIERPGNLKNAHGRRTIIRVCHPGSCLVQSFFLANFCMELARNQFPVFVWDCLDGNETGIESIMKSLVLERKDAEAATVRLYGLPDILIHGPGTHDADKLIDLVNIIRSSNDSGYLLVNADSSSVSVADHEFPDEHILLSETDEKSLLQCYAHIKFILDKSFSSGIFIVLDGLGDEKSAQETFKRFAAFIDKKLNKSIKYLGNLSHDEYLERSVEEAKPLMLSQDRSETKDNMISISKNFLYSGQIDKNS